MSLHIIGRQWRGRSVDFGLRRWSPVGWRFGTTDVATDRHRMGWMKWRLADAGLRWPERTCPWMPAWVCRAFAGAACADEARMQERGCWRWLRRSRGSVDAPSAPQQTPLPVPVAVASKTERTAPERGQLKLSL